MRAYSTVQQLLCHEGYCELILSLARTSCRLLFTVSPTARPLASNPLRDVVRSRNPSKSTLAHDAVSTVVLLVIPIAAHTAPTTLTWYGRLLSTAARWPETHCDARTPTMSPPMTSAHTATGKDACWELQHKRLVCPAPKT